MCLGAMLFGSRIDEATSMRLLDLYVEAGGTFIDTANVYAKWIPGCEGGESEALLGRWMKQRGNRAKLFIATKMGSRLQASGRGLRPQQIVEECDRSLRRMGIETIDLYYAHFFCPTTPVEESMAAFDRLRKAGKVRFLGASNHPAWRLAEANAVAAARGLTPYCCIQQRYSYLWPRRDASFDVQVAATPELLDYCRERKVTMLAYSPLLGGAYGRPDRDFDKRYDTPEKARRLEALASVARERNVSPNVVVLAWMMQSDPPVIPIFSASTESQMKENLSALALRLSDSDMRRLNGPADA
mgnify:FL=1